VTVGLVGRPVDGVDVTIVDDRAFLLHPDTARVLVLNPTAYAVWQACAGGGDVEEITRDLADVFEVAAVDIRDEVEAAVAEFADQGFLRQ
jgi:hypothetical protein